jgi:hypothetical protein
VPVGEWEAITQEPTKHDTDDTIDERLHSNPFLMLFFCYLSRNFEDEIFLRRGEYNGQNNYLSLGSLVR